MAFDGDFAALFLQCEENVLRYASVEVVSSNLAGYIGIVLQPGSEGFCVKQAALGEQRQGHSERIGKGRPRAFRQLRLGGPYAAPGRVGELLDRADEKRTSEHSPFLCRDALLYEVREVAKPHAQLVLVVEAGEVRASVEKRRKARRMFRCRLVVSGFTPLRIREHDVFLPDVPLCESSAVFTIDGEESFASSLVEQFKIAHAKRPGA